MTRIKLDNYLKNTALKRILKKYSSKDFSQILKEDKKFKSYIYDLAKTVPSDVRPEFISCCYLVRNLAIPKSNRKARVTKEDTQVLKLLKESLTSSISYYAPLLFPVMAIYFPKSVAFRTTTVVPMDKPSMVIARQKAFGIDLTGSSQPSGKTYSVVVSPGTSNLNILAGISPQVIQRNVVITLATSGTNTIPVQAAINPDGTFAIPVKIGSNTDVIIGHIDFKTGQITYKSKNGLITNITVSFSPSQEQNTNVNQVQLKYETQPITAKTYKMSFKVSPEAIQDFKSLYNVDLIQELANLITNQILLDIDKQVIQDYLSVLSASSNVETFQKNPPSSFSGTLKMWYENLPIAIRRVVSQVILPYDYIYVLANPIDAVMLNSIGLNKIIPLQSPVVPAGTMIVVPKVRQPEASVYITGVYLPPVILPNLPAGNLYTGTVMARLATQMVRPEAIGFVRIV